jgi:hypothetical protein
MKNWTAIAAASGAAIPADQAERIARPLESLEASFRPLVRSLTFADEPATIFSAGEDAE